MFALPRTRDAAKRRCRLAWSYTTERALLMLSLDFSDAFKQPPVKHCEKRHLSGRALDGYFYYHKVLFGIKTGPPLVWRRLSALIVRCIQSCFHPLRLRQQLLVDDPLVDYMRGPTSHLKGMVTKVLFLRRALGFKIAWRKGTCRCTTQTSCTTQIGSEQNSHSTMIRITLRWNRSWQDPVWGIQTDSKGAGSVSQASAEICGKDELGSCRHCNSDEALCPYAVRRAVQLNSTWTERSQANTSSWRLTLGNLAVLTSLLTRLGAEPSS